MDGLLTAAGFPGVEVEDGVIHARLSASGAEFSVVPEAGRWLFSLCWPVRASAEQRADFMAAHPGTMMDIWHGETRLRLRAGPDGLAHWAAVAEAAAVAMAGWRRAQRSQGEGM